MSEIPISGGIYERFNEFDAYIIMSCLVHDIFLLKLLSGLSGPLCVAHRRFFVRSTSARSWFVPKVLSQVICNPAGKHTF